MTNYKKYFGKKRKAAALILECGELAAKFSSEICCPGKQGCDSLMKNGDLICRDREFHKCIMKWLKKKAR